MTRPLRCEPESLSECAWLRNGGTDHLWRWLLGIVVSGLFVCGRAWLDGHSGLCPLMFDLLRSESRGHGEELVFADVGALAPNGDLAREAACDVGSRACERRSKRPVPLQEAESGGSFGALAPNGQVLARGSLSTSTASSERPTSGPWPLMSDLQGRHAYQLCRECRLADLVIE